MDVLRLVTDDYELTVRADGVDTSFRRATLRNTSIESATTYSFSGSNSVFELAICSENQLKNDLSIAAFNSKLHPVFFENKEYFFDIIFKHKTDAEPLIHVPLEEIKKTFIARKVKDAYFLTGVVNYRNDIGKSDFVLKYKKEGVTITHILNFEVFPVKLDYKSDYNEILSDINNEFSSLVFDILKKTYAGFNNGDEINNDIVWWSVFGQLYQNILLSSRLILNKPHNRLVQNTYYSKGDRIRHLPPLLEEHIAEHKENAQKYYRVETKTLSHNTIENQFFKYSIVFLYKKFNIIHNKLLSIYGVKITAEFKEELEHIKKQFSIIIQNPFFKQISDFKSFKNESMVLQKASGYSGLFRSWIMLKKGIDFLDGVNKIELKNIAELYEIWCFIELKNMVQQVLNKKPEEVNLAEILIDGFTIKLRSGTKSKVSFKKDNGDLVELFHELKFTRTLFQNNLTHTISQEPDIVLRITKNDLQDNHIFTYLFDAKYRLISDDKEDSKDYPPDDAINQMHRYRDAIFYQSNDDGIKPKKEVIGAYVLFPGSDEAKETEGLYFQRSITKVNIGAYPLIPGSKKAKNNLLLVDFLKSILLEKESLNILNDDVIPYKSMKYEDPDAMVLVGFLKGEDQKKYFVNEASPLYHMPVYKKNGLVNTIRNLDKLKYFCPVLDGIRYYFKIQDIKVISRKDIFSYPHKLYKNSDESYYVFTLGNKKEITPKIDTLGGGNRVFRYARFSELRSSKTIADFNKVSQEVE